MTRLQDSGRQLAADVNMLMTDIKAASTHRARRALADVDLYVHRHPWRIAGVAALTAVALGAAVGAMATRH